MENQSQTTPANPVKRTGTSNRGFASMSPERQRQIASQGGKAAHLKGTAHEFSSEEARAAGRKGGQSRGAHAAALRAQASAQTANLNSSSGNTTLQ
jgi:general stress protein YciG